MKLLNKKINIHGGSIKGYTFNKNKKYRIDKSGKP